MANQILSQEEIDALLSAMDKGEVDLRQEQNGEMDCRPLDLTEQNIAIGNQFPFLDRVTDRLVRRLQASLSSAFQRPIIIQMDCTRAVKFSDFVRMFSNPTGLTIFNANPLAGNGVFAVDSQLFFVLLDCWFGGVGQPVDQIKEFTELELRIMKKLIRQVLKDLQTAWEVVDRINVSLSKIETNPAFLDGNDSNEAMMVVIMTVSVNAFEGRMYFGYPHAMLTSAKENFSISSNVPEGLKKNINSRMQHLLYDTPVTVIAELGKAVCSLRDLLNLQVGDILKLEKGPEDAILLKVNEVSKYSGVPGVIKGNRAVQINEILV
jgi:flagellar motor switch protein FliM